MNEVGTFFYSQNRTCDQLSMELYEGTTVHVSFHHPQTQSFQKPNRTL